MIVAPENMPNEAMSDFVAVPLLSLEDLTRRPIDASRVERLHHGVSPVAAEPRGNGRCYP